MCRLRSSPAGRGQTVPTSLAKCSSGGRAFLDAGKIPDISGYSLVGKIRPDGRAIGVSLATAPILRVRKTLQHAFGAISDDDYVAFHFLDLVKLQARENM